MNGRKFGKLTVLKFAGNNIHRKKMWQCLCECGSLVVVVGSSLRSGATSSCRCFQKTHARTHGMSRVGCSEYRTWANILSRCNDPNNSGYHNYGGRGIQVCDEWLSFENFYADMGPKPSSLHSIDRFPDNNGNYSPINCRWATKKQQDRNRRTNRLLTFQGITLCLLEWAERIQLHPVTLSWRLDNGWSVEKALTTRSKGAAK